MREHMQVPTFQYRLGAVLTGVFSAFALLLAGLGLYAVIAHAVAERRTEIGLRLALGASRSEIAKLVAGTVATLVLVGAMLGVFIGAAVARAAAAQMRGVEANDVGAYAASLIVTALVGAAATALPAWRAATVNPISALRR